jgi:fused signal recognition particle receptor
MFSFFKKKPVEAPAALAAQAAPEIATPIAIESIALRADSMPATALKASENALETVADTTPPAAERKSWMDKLKNGLRKTGSSIATVFTGTQIDDALYEELEAALLMSDAGVAATAHLLADLKRRVKEAKATEPSAVKALLAEALADLLLPLQKPLTIGQHKPTVMMITGVNGAGKTTSIGKLTWHLSGQGASVLLAAADTFRAAAKEQLAVWATRNNVEIISQDNADPAAVAFDAVTAGKARQRDVVMVDTAGRLPTQLHLMEEIAKIKRVITKAESTAPHETLLVIDGNTGQNALAQVKAFDASLQLTGLIITKLDGTAKGGVLAAIALWAKQRHEERADKQPDLKPVAVYFIGVGEKVEDLETFDAKEFAQALIA